MVHFGDFVYIFVIFSTLVGATGPVEVGVLPDLVSTGADTDEVKVALDRSQIQELPLPSTPDDEKKMDDFVPTSDHEQLVTADIETEECVEVSSKSVAFHMSKDK